MRTALLFPVYQEDTARIAATIECVSRELIALGAEKRFDIFVLSDSRLGDIRARELRAVRFLRRACAMRARSTTGAGAERRQEGRQHRRLAAAVRRRL